MIWDALGKVGLQNAIIEACLGGEIGRHNGLKIRRFVHSGHAGSIPARGTNLLFLNNILIKLHSQKECFFLDFIVTQSLHKNVVGSMMKSSFCARNVSDAAEIER